MNYTFYKIYSKDPSITECYIGSTKDFNQRKAKHKSDCNNINEPNYKIKLYQYIRSNGGFEAFEFEIIDTITFSKTDRLFHERKLVKLYGATLNTLVRPIITEEEYKEYEKEYRETHKEKIKEYQKEYRETHKEETKNKKNKKIVCDVCGGKYTVSHKSCHLKTKKHINQINL